MLSTPVLAMFSLAADPRVTEDSPERLINRCAEVITHWLHILKEAHYIRNELFCGTVTELTADTISIRWLTAPRTFEVAPTVASKDLPIEADYRWRHRLGDVRVGDKVGVCLVRTPRGYVVVALGIYRRPGGKVPVAEDSHIPEKYRAHNWCNTAQFAEEKVLPQLSRMFLHFHR